jgi:arabinan endo-1,5-alpha-L-arabinosidase
MRNRWIPGSLLFAGIAALTLAGCSGSSSHTGREAGGESAAGGSAEAGTASETGEAGETGEPSQPVGQGGAAGGSSGAGGTSTTREPAADGGGAAGAGGGSGGIAGSGGSVAAGGTLGSATTDRCDVGIYDATHPPKALALTGSLGAHDPSALESNGVFYEFQTGLGAKTSTDLLSWKDASAPLAVPAWIKSAIAGVTDLWAPDISYFGGAFHLYYAGSTFGSNKSCIGHATRPSLSAGSWLDQGSATLCSNVTTTGDNWNAIDPNTIVDTDGTPWLTFGSFWGGIKIVQLDASGARVGSTVTGIAARPQSGGALEAPFLVRRCGYYYLFTSWDACCKGASSTYNIRVVRGTSVSGPFVDQAGIAAMQGGGTLVAKGDSTWAGPGGQSILFVGKQAYLVYHAYAVSNGAATLRIADLVWDATGWPVPVGP